MRSCLVLGTGRSGTSLVSGLLAGAGYRTGDGAYLPRAANPYGFFETPSINGLNEELLAPVLPPRPALSRGQLWLAVPGRAVPTCVAPELVARMRAALPEGPFCLKDPRFSFTLPAWRPFLADTAFVTAFRHPASTAVSMLEEVRRAEYLKGVELDLEHVLRLWVEAYRLVLEEHSGRGDWLFLHYDQAIDPRGRRRLAELTGAPLDGSFADAKLRRAEPDVPVPDEALRLYGELCARAEHDPRTVVRAPLAEISVVALVRPGEEGGVDALVQDVREQRGVAPELVVVDATRDGLGDVAGARVVRARSWAAGAAWSAGIAAASHELVAFQRPGCRPLASRLAHAVDALASPGVDLVTCDYFLTDDGGQFVGRANPSLMAGAPGPFWESGVVGRRSVLSGLPREAFRPAELLLYRDLAAAGRVGHVVEPGFAVERTRYGDLWEEARVDAQLATLALQPHAGPPELSVSLCTYDRPDVLLESLAGFCRQTLPPGAFEVVIVDDGEPSGTRADLEGLELPVPTVYRRGPGRGLAAARNDALAHSRGRYTLFVNDDTVPAPDLVEQHLRAHARLGVPASVLGTFEQPREALDNALLRYLERSGEVFGYAGMTPGEWHDAFHLYTCNVSVPVESVRAAGGFDESFRFYGCEDTDLGVRLEARGCRVFYEARARAWHRHAMDFEYLARRQRTVARAYVHFFRKHPHLLAAWGNEDVAVDWAAPRLAAAAAEAERLSDAVRELAALDVGALERLGGEYAALASEVLERLGEWVPVLDRFWWQEGYLRGMRASGLSGFRELLEGGADSWPLATAAPRRALAWPRWESADALDRLLALARPLAGLGGPALVLRLDPQGPIARDAALSALEAAYGRVFPEADPLEVVLEEAPLGAAELRRLGRTVDVFLVTGDEPEDVRAAVVAEPLSSVEEVVRWRARGERAAGPEAAEETAAPEPTPETSVVVPTRDRPRELLQLLEHLERQDVDPHRFEVIVVDDGSRSEVGAELPSRPWPFELRVVRQAPGGPAAARNRALEVARGELVVFFNDDAVPAPDCLRRHREAHLAADALVAVLGTFSLQRQHVRTSCARWIESSTALFGQPEMQPGVAYHGLALCTGNVSVAREALVAVGGFDEEFPWAGCEDSELGVRLERELGVRVLHDPLVRCEHDHALDVRGLVARRRVVGWGAWRIFRKHGDPAVLGPDARPEDPQWWEELRCRTEADEAGCARLLEQLADLGQRELRTGRVAADAAALRGAFERLSLHAFHAGLLAARAGREPTGASAPVAAEPVAAEPVHR